jgi:hypothetical protein
MNQTGLRTVTNPLSSIDFSQEWLGLLVKRLIKTESIPVNEEEMQVLYLDGRAIRRYCLQCRGPKFMVPAKKSASQSDLGDGKIPDKLQIVCKTCGIKYTAKLTSVEIPTQE